MLKQLRNKFILLNMIIVTAVLLVAFTAICAVSHRNEMQKVDEALADSLMQAVQFAEADFSHMQTIINPQERDEKSPVENGQTVDQENPDPQVAPSMTPPQIGGFKGGMKDSQIPVAVYALSPSGTLVEVSVDISATLSDEVLNKAAQLLSEQASSIGTTNALHPLGLYYRIETARSMTYVAFVDMSEAGSWKNLALILGIIGIVMLVVFFLISLFFSRWSLRPVEKAWQSQRRFVADASHDLKTPLTVIMANNSIMKEHPEATISDMEQWLESTEEEARDMQQLVSDMLVLAQLDEAADARGSSTPGGAAAKKIDFSSLVQSKVLQYEALAYEEQVTLDSQIQENIEIVGDRPQLGRLISTLLDNACKYTPQGGKINVSLRYSSDSKNALFMVHNTGDPISEEDLPHVFDRFYRVDNARSDDGTPNTNNRKSHGLGLAIARSIVEEHGGEISVTSSADAGTAFSVSFKL